MPQSNINKNFSFNENRWVISVIKVGHGFGHSILYIEGLLSKGISFRPEFYIKGYDIQAELFKEQKNMVDQTGFIKEIRCFTGYTDSNFDQLASKSYYVLPALVLKMIESIEQDVKLCRSQEENKISPQERTPYSLLGKNPSIILTTFIKTEGFHNCASWVLEKLSIAGIGDGTGKSKPKSLVSSCMIL